MSRDIDVSEGLNEFKRLERDGWRHERLSSFWERWAKEKGHDYVEVLSGKICDYQQGKEPLRRRTASNKPYDIIAAR